MKPIPHIAWGILLAGALTVAPAGARQSAPPRPAPESGTTQIKIPFEQYQLPNGLTVILNEDHRTPTATVAIVYHVGSKNEKPGRTGFAHLFEHVMFTGSGHVPYGLHDRYTEGVGGGNNGQTSNDETVYYENIPANYLETALWLESDRMGWLLDSLDLKKLNNQRDVVKNERRQSVDNQPYGRVDEILAAATYPKTHPYSWPVIGSMKDLTAASPEDVKEFFRLYYAPNNAVLTISGDFRPVQVKPLIAKYFGPIPRGKPITRPKVAPLTLSAEKRLVYEDRVQIPRLFIRWPVIGGREEDQFPLDILAEVLTGSRTARLTKELVYDQQTATSVGASNATSEDVGDFDITISPRPGNSLQKLEETTDRILARIKEEGPTADELQKAKAGAELGFLSGLESNLGKAMTLADGYVFHRNPAYFQEQYRKTQAVTAEDVKRVANKYLGAGRVVLSVVPLGKKELASKPEASQSAGSAATTSEGR